MNRRARVGARLRTLVVTLSLTAALQVATAHRLDECLQAARITVEPQRIALELDLTPGVETAAQLLALIDQDRDGQVSSVEEESYADLVRSALLLRIDGRKQSLLLHGFEFPTAQEMTNGLGTLRLTLGARISALRPGAHQLYFSNQHQTNFSVYLVNALVPKSPSIRVTAQRRDLLQRQFTLEFEVERSEPEARHNIPFQP